MWGRSDSPVLAGVEGRGGGHHADGERGGRALRGPRRAEAHGDAGVAQPRVLKAGSRPGRSAQSTEVSEGLTGTA